MITKQFPGDFQGTVIIKDLDVGAFAYLIVDFGQVADLVAAVGQSLEEVILVVLVGVTVPVVVVVQRRRAEERLLEGANSRVWGAKSPSRLPVEHVAAAICLTWRILLWAGKAM